MTVHDPRIPSQYDVRPGATAVHALGAAKDVLGLMGEDLAAEHLAAKGLHIVARRLRVAGGDIDLIALDGDEVVFVEVKTRRGGGYGTPEESITAIKRARLRRAAALCMAGAFGASGTSGARGRTAEVDALARQLRGRPYRIDVVAVTVSRMSGGFAGPQAAARAVAQAAPLGEPRIEHFENAVGEE